MRRLFSVPLFFVCLVHAQDLSNTLSNRRAPGFSLPDANLQQYDPQDYRGKVLLVEFMQTSCAHCQEFSRILQQVPARYGEKVAVLSIVNPPDTQTSVLRYIAERKILAPILFDCGQVAASYVKAGPQNSTITIPHIFVIDAQGVIRSDFSYGQLTRGIFEGEDLFTLLDHMLKPKH